MTTKTIVRVEDPPIAKMLFDDVRLAWVWLLVRLYVGYAWLSEGIDKITSPVWGGAKAGTVLSAWLKGALAKTHGAHPDVQGWYGAFLQTFVVPHAAFWSVLVSYGEFFVGLGLILGLFTGIAAFFGTMMNSSYLLAGTVSINPILLGLGTFIVLAWKVAGYWGLDRFVLARLGTPWQHGPIEMPGVPEPTSATP